MMHTLRPPIGAAIDQEKVRVAASLACTIHCVMLPILITVLPLLGLTLLAHPRVQAGLIDLSALIGVFSLCVGFREHGRPRALWVLCAGLALILLGAIAEQQHWGRFAPVVVICGGSTITLAHLMNRRLCRACRQRRYSFEDWVRQNIG